MACLAQQWNSRPVTLLFLCCALAAADPVDPTPAGVVVDVGAVAPSDRVVAGAGAAIGAAAGGFIGGSLALGLSAVLSDFDARASLLPLLVLPPLGAGLGAFVTGTAVSDPTVGLAGGAAAAGATAVWAIALAAVLVGDDDRLLSLPGEAGRFDLTFAATALVPAVVAVVGAGLVAPWFASPSQIVAADEE